MLKTRVKVSVMTGLPHSKSSSEIPAIYTGLKVRHCKGCPQ
jgi:hypothetical protein